MQKNGIQTKQILLLLGFSVLAFGLGALLYSTHLENTALKTELKLPSETDSNGELLAQVYFDTGSATMPEESGGAIQTVVEQATENPQSLVLISGFHDPSGDPEKNIILAAARAEAARKELIAAGLPAERIIMQKPAMIPGSEDMQEARRVDFLLK